MNPRLLIYLLQLKIGAEFDRFYPKTVKPFACNIKLTENCQSRCITCSYWQEKWDDLISTEKAKSLLIDDLPALGIKYLRFTGGEPLLRKDLFEIVESIPKGVYKRIILKTNGLLIGKYASEINNSQITDVSVSIDGLEETNDKIRGIKGGFKKVFKELKTLENKRIEITPTLTKHSATELNDFITFVKNKGYTWGYNLIDTNMYFFKNLDLKELAAMSKEDVVQIIDDLKRNYDHPLNSELSFVESYLTGVDTKDRFHCYLGYLLLDIAANGDLYSGCYALKPMGNILTQPVSSIVQSPVYAKRAKAMLKKQCPNCTCGFKYNLKMDHAFESLIFSLKSKISA